MLRESRRTATLAILLALSMLSAGCSSVVTGHAVPGRVVTKPGADTSSIRGSDGGPIDQLAATSMTDIEAYWQDAFPTAFGKPWAKISGGIYSVDTSDANAKPPPCAESASDVEGNAFYCPAADAIAWDRAALLPVLKDKFGEAAVVIVLAHEMGHAVQRRSGITPEAERRQPDRYPTILIEAMADCYAGTFMRWVNDGRSRSLNIGADALDSALGALITFRDPVGTSPADQDAHGSAFDRVSAFQDGYEKGTKFCADMSVDNRVFTQRSFTSTDDRARNGNLPFDEMLASVTPDLNTYFSAVVTQLGKTWTEPKAQPTDSEPNCSGDQGPIAFCPGEKAIEVEVKGKLPELHKKIGDYATGTLLASRYGLAAMAAVGKKLDGDKASRDAVCLAGAYTGMVLARQEGFGLSPGDMDEAVQVLLGYDYVARDVKGESVLGPGFQRVAVFRGGVFDGPKSCGLG